MSEAPLRSADVADAYNARLADRERAHDALTRRHVIYGNIRVGLVVAIVAIAAIWGWQATVIEALLVAVFVVASIAHILLLNRRDRAASAVAFYQRGLARISDRWIGHGSGGERFRVPDHLFADDLDLFGRGSLFELIATVRTRAGEDTLARWLLEPAPPGVIRSRQDAVRELMPRLDLRESVAVLGDAMGVGVDAAALRAWSAAPVRLRGVAARLGLFLMAATTAATIGVAMSMPVPSSVVLAVLGVQSGIALWYRGRVQQVIGGVAAALRDLSLLSGVFRTIERERFSSPHLTHLQAALGAGGRVASAEIDRLARLESTLSSRRNLLFAIPAALLLWATQWAFAIEAWRARVGGHLPGWLDAAGEFEALLALAGFAAERPGHVFPDLREAPPCLEAVALAHPLLPAGAVPNDVSIGGAAPHLLIVSGSNMSGKSTFLRAIGVNVVLAQMGAPVRAARFSWSPVALGAAMRLQDSLVDGRSRFFAEILRLEQIVTLARRERGAVLFLLDEILAGTNSHDRRQGAEGLLTGLVDLGAIGLVTTHDLALGAIADRLAGRADNVHFEDRFDAGGLSFDYRLRPGIVRTSNAIALMRSIGLEV